MCFKDDREEEGVDIAAILLMFVSLLTFVEAGGIGTRFGRVCNMVRKSWTHHRDIKVGTLTILPNRHKHVTRSLFALTNTGFLLRRGFRCLKIQEELVSKSIVPRDPVTR